MSLEQTFMSFRKTIQSLSYSQKSTLQRNIFANILVALLEFIGIAVFTLAISSILGRADGPSALPFGFEKNRFLKNIIGSNVALFLFAIGLLIIKSIASLAMIRNTYYSLATLTQQQTKRYLENLSGLTWSEINKFDSSKVNQILVDSIRIRYMGVLGNFTYIFCEVSVIFGLFAILIFIDYQFFMIFSLYFIAVIIILYRKVTLTSFRLGVEISRNESLARKRLDEYISLYRELYTIGKTKKFGNRFLDTQQKYTYAKASAEVNHAVPKYFLEISSMIGLGIFFLFLFKFRTSSEAITSGSVYLFGMTRLLPSLIRLQGYWAEFSKSCGSELDIDEILENFEHSNSKKLFEKVEISSLSSDTLIKIQDMSYKFHDSDVEIFTSINLEVKRNKIIAIVGESGAGKSTFCELICGLISPSRGAIAYSPEMLDEFGNLKAGSIVYLPQSSHVFLGSILENVSLETEISKENTSRVDEALKAASASEFVSRMSDGIHTIIGDGGVKMSGGQMQRILLARTLYANPDVVILDEPLSGIDEATQLDINAYIESLRDRASILVVTHDHSNLEKYDEVLEISNAQGNLRRLR